MTNIVGPLNFWIYVVESPSAEDMYVGRSEADIIQRAAALNGIPAIRRTVINRSALFTALTDGFRQAQSLHVGSTPILHLSVHGREEGIGLSNEDFLSWADLREMLQPIHDSIGCTLLVCMSTCVGVNAARMAAQFDATQVPFLALVGHVGTPLWSDTAVGYAAFYHRFAKGEHISVAVEAMKHASGNNGFCVLHADSVRGTFLEEVRKLLMAA